MDLTTLTQHPVVHAAVTGFVTAAAADLSAFRSWKSVHDAYTYDWRVAAWRWFQGTALGALTGLGLAGLT